MKSKENISQRREGNSIPGIRGNSIPKEKDTIKTGIRKRIYSRRDQFSLEGKTVLVVENEESHLLLIQSILGLYKINVIGVKDGYSAVKICQENHDKIDLVLMDIKIPDMDGLETTKLIKAINKDIPVVAQTACVMLEDEQRCLKAGCDDYLAKPISRLQLLRKLNKFLNE